jgi:prophage regulatory protein
VSSYDLPTVMKKTGMSRSAIYRWERDGKFPKRIKTSVGKMRWRKEAIDDWIDKRRARVSHNALLGCGCCEFHADGALHVRAPRGLVFRVGDVLRHHVPYDKEGYDLKLFQCPDFPFCKECK